MMCFYINSFVVLCGILLQGHSFSTDSHFTIGAEPFYVWPGPNITINKCQADCNLALNLLFVIQNCDHHVRAFVGEKLITSKDDTFHEQCSINNGSDLGEGTWIVSLTVNVTDVFQKWTKNESVPVVFRAGKYTKTSYLIRTEDCQCCTCECPTENNTSVYTLTDNTLDNTSEEVEGVSGRVDSVLTTSDKSISLTTHYYSFLVTIFVLKCVL